MRDLGAPASVDPTKMSGKSAGPSSVGVLGDEQGRRRRAPPSRSQLDMTSPEGGTAQPLNALAAQAGAMHDTAAGYQHALPLPSDDVCDSMLAEMRKVAAREAADFVTEQILQPGVASIDTLSTSDEGEGAVATTPPQPLLEIPAARRSLQNIGTPPICPRRGSGASEREAFPAAREETHPDPATPPLTPLSRAQSAERRNSAGLEDRTPGRPFSTPARPLPSASPSAAHGAEAADATPRSQRRERTWTFPHYHPSDTATADLRAVQLTPTPAPPAEARVALRTAPHTPQYSQSVRVGRVAVVCGDGPNTDPHRQSNQSSVGLDPYRMVTYGIEDDDEGDAIVEADELSLDVDDFDDAMPEPLDSSRGNIGGIRVSPIPQRQARASSSPLRQNLRDGRNFEPDAYRGRIAVRASRERVLAEKDWESDPHWAAMEAQSYTQFVEAVSNIRTKTSAHAALEYLGEAERRVDEKLERSPSRSRSEQAATAFTHWLTTHQHLLKEHRTAPITPTRVLRGAGAGAQRASAKGVSEDEVLKDSHNTPIRSCASHTPTTEASTTTTRPLSDIAPRGEDPSLVHLSVPHVVGGASPRERWSAHSHRYEAGGTVTIVSGPSTSPRWAGMSMGTVMGRRYKPSVRDERKPTEPRDRSPSARSTRNAQLPVASRDVSPGASSAVTLTPSVSPRRVLAHSFADDRCVAQFKAPPNSPEERPTSHPRPGYVSNDAGRHPRSLTTSPLPSISVSPARSRGSDLSPQRGDHSLSGISQVGSHSDAGSLSVLRHRPSRSNSRGASETATYGTTTCEVPNWRTTHRSVYEAQERARRRAQSATNQRIKPFPTSSVVETGGLSRFTASQAGRCVYTSHLSRAHGVHAPPGRAAGRPVGAMHAQPGIDLTILTSLKANWTHREQLMVMLQRRVQNGWVPDRHEGLHELTNALAVQLTDHRMGAAKAAAGVLRELAASLGEQYTDDAATMIPVLLGVFTRKGVQVTLLNAVHAALQALLRECAPCNAFATLIAATAEAGGRATSAAQNTHTRVALTDLLADLVEAVGARVAAVVDASAEGVDGRVLHQSTVLPWGHTVGRLRQLFAAEHNIRTTGVVLRSRGTVLQDHAVVPCPREHDAQLVSPHLPALLAHTAQLVHDPEACVSLATARLFWAMYPLRPCGLEEIYTTLPLHIRRVLHQNRPARSHVALPELMLLRNLTEANRYRDRDI
eukprot:TRINITY_DN16526_c0_g1_i1.p1 TRINITY_DN16526_c0_g1~~TRINITY_DN16526_c0_g1_i1.p1  ORF type:complete len:1210 (+),score=22.76 TRINITY_DN16526_c0_g1_i1:65-3694(+)